VIAIEWMKKERAKVPSTARLGRARLGKESASGENPGVEKGRRRGVNLPPSLALSFALPPPPLYIYTYICISMCIYVYIV